ncbi:MAG: DNA polymerase/3'-5' exonuclease PolX [Candidatus Omnitrophica bacterium]|nr:DNA polymerase/3'-5' exonuclease PolX [Candidatus Omnitrophota bacterium]
MNNKEIASIFYRIGDALEIKGENVFKIRAYRRAARNIMDLPREVSALFQQDPSRINSIPGVGRDLKEKIVEMLSSGRLAYFESLMKEFPPGFFDMLKLSGLGPKRLKKFKEKLNIKNIDDLEKACRQHSLSKLEGEGERAEAKLSAAIEYYKKGVGRFLLQDAEYIAEKTVAYLKKSSVFKKIEIAGSLRRGKETVGDIDILAEVRDKSKAMDYFAAMPLAEKIIAKGAVKSSILVKGGAQLDLRVASAGSFGAALMYFTGSKAHNIKLRRIAKLKKRKVNEYGIFSVSAGGKEKKLAGKTEKDVYQKLGMPWIPPELREDNGEIEAALAGRLPENLLTEKDILGDLHLHTRETDGNVSVKDIVKEAKRRGYKYIAITNHSKYVRIARGMDEKRLLAHVADIRKISADISGIKVFAGIEVDILEDGRLDLEDYALKELDIVIAAVHSHFSLDEKKQTERMIKALNNKYVNVLAHPSGRLITTRTPISLDFEKIFLLCAKNNVFLEVNTHGERIDLNDLHCRMAKNLGAKFVINTDAHDIAQLDAMKYGVITARRAWLEKKDVLNTYAAGKLIKALCRGE